MIGQCSNELLKAALAGSLPADEEEALCRHLEVCEACSAAMEQMAGCASWRQEAAALLAGDELDHAVPSHDELSEVDFTVEYLEPSDEPNVLGRLGGYDVLAILGRGGMGVVLKAFERELKRCVAIKVLAPHLAHSSLAKKRFAREAQAAAAVVHPNVLAIHQVQPGGRLPFLVMPLIAGESLAERLQAQGPLELKEILRIGMQAAAGLAAAHDQGLVHRDVKPANILLEMGVERAVLTDFGLARAADDVSMTRWGIIAGTPEYMSPEQAKGEPLDGRSDLFSLGCVLYEMATGVSPFRTDSAMATMRRLVDDSPKPMASLNPELPPWFIAIVDRLLEKEPSRRFGSAKEVNELLEGCLAHVQQPGTVPLPAAHPQPAGQPDSARRKFRFKGVIAIFGILAISLLGWFMLPSQEPPDIAGQWTGEDWGTVVLKKSSDKEYTGTYTDTVGNHPGEIQLKWSRIEQRFNGTWREGEDRFGEISVRLVNNEIRGALTTDAKSKINPATPRLADLTWVKAKPGPTPVPGQFPPPIGVLPSPADALKRADIPQRLLEVAGGGNAAKAPPELVWVFDTDNEGNPADPVVNSLAVSPDGHWLAVFRKKTAQLWDLKTGQATFALKGSEGDSYWYTTFSPDSTLVAATTPGKVALWNTTTGAIQRTMTGTIGGTQLLFSPDGKILSAFGSDGKVKRWLVDTGQPLAVQWTEQLDVVRVAFSPDGTLVALMRKGKTIHFLDAKTGALVKNLAVLNTSAEVLFSADGKTFVWKSNSRFSQHQMWDVATFRRIPGPPGSGPIIFGTPNGLAIHPTRRLVATTWSDDATLRLWEMVQGLERMQTFTMEASGKVANRPLAFTPEGRYLAVAHYNGAVSLLRVPDALPGPPP